VSGTGDSSRHDDGPGPRGRTSARRQQAPNYRDKTQQDQTYRNPSYPHQPTAYGDYSSGYRSAPGDVDLTRTGSRRRRQKAKPEPGLPGWAAVGVLIVIAGIGGVIDQISGASIQGAFNWALILASLVAILIVRRSQMFAVVIAPPLVYFVASAAKLYITSNGLKDRSALTDAAANWLVYGFPAIAGATAIVLVIAGVRMILRR
jgi:uncharacterized protein DUF6542